MKPRLARLLELVVFYGLLSVIVLSAIPYGSVEPWWIAVVECLVFGLALLALLEAFISKTLHLEGLSLAAPLLILVLFIFGQSLSFLSAGEVAGVFNLSSAISADPYSSRLFAIYLFALITAGVLLLRYTSNKGRLRALIVAVVVVAVASALFGIVKKNFEQGPGFVLPHLSAGRANFGQFINKNHFAYLMEMTLGLLLGLTFGAVGSRRRVLALLPIIGLLWFALIWSNSRGGILASLCQLLFLGAVLGTVSYASKESSQKTNNRLRALAGSMALRLALIVSLTVVFVTGVVWVGGEPVVSNFETAATDFSQAGAGNRANTSRRLMWATTWQMIKAHPITGSGFGGYWIAVTRHHNGSGELTPQEAHNDYLDLLASGGLVGCALAIWFLVLGLKLASSNMRSSDFLGRAASLGALTGIFGVAIHSFLDFGLHVTVNALVFVALVVIAVHKHSWATQSASDVDSKFISAAVS